MHESPAERLESGSLSSQASVWASLERRARMDARSTGPCSSPMAYAADDTGDSPSSWTGLCSRSTRADELPDTTSSCRIGANLGVRELSGDGSPSPTVQLF